MPARFHVVVRFAGRIVDDRCVEDALSLGDGGDVVVPGLGDAAVVLRDGRLCAVAGLEGAVDGLALQEGEHAELRSVTYPELAIAIERISSERVKMRDRFFTLPARETIFAGALAGCLATMLGGKVVIGSLTEAEVEEREQTALELAMFEATPVIPAITFAPPMVIIEPVAPEPTVLAEASIVAPPSVRDEIGESVAPLAQEVVTKAPKRKRARPRRRPPEVAEINAILDAGDNFGMLGTLSDRSAIADLVVSDRIEGGVIGGVPGDVEGLGGLAIVGAGTGEPPTERAVPTMIDPEEEPASSKAEPAGAAVVVKAEPIPNDPRGGKFTLADAFAGSEELAHGTGALVAHMRVGDQQLRCELFEDRAPIAVANFVGLIRGTRETLDPATNRWVKKRFYEGLTIHRIVDGFVIQGGDPKGDGTGGPGYRIADEIDPGFHFDRPGILGLARSGAKDSGGSQFFVTLESAPHLDGREVAFGQCDPEAPRALGRVATGSLDRPDKPVKIGKAWVEREQQHPEPARESTHEADPPAEPAPRDPSQAGPPEGVAPSGAR
jgi:peptidyl-prolyl cis-trans isomerase A (cyclophilin A)